VTTITSYPVDDPASGTRTQTLPHQLGSCSQGTRDIFGNNMTLCNDVILQ
jgi:hypothetical protein